MSAAGSEAASGAGAPRLRWIDLLLRPETFFPEGARRLHGPLLLALIAIAGAAGAIDRLETSAMGRSIRMGELQVVASWAAYWSTVAAGSLISGPLFYFVGGWWYRVRARWSGATAPGPLLCRRIHLLASSVVAVPTLVFLVFETLYSETPREAWSSAPVAITQVVAVFYSVYVSHQAAVASFELRRGAALVWFAVLPALFYAIVILGAGLYAADALG